jgi:DNA repair exonuclease SbcCD ATPase subunit
LLVLVLWERIFNNKTWEGYMSESGNVGKKEISLDDFLQSVKDGSEGNFEHKIFSGISKSLSSKENLTGNTTFDERIAEIYRDGAQDMAQMMVGSVQNLVADNTAKEKEIENSHQAIKNLNSKLNEDKLAYERLVNAARSLKIKLTDVKEVAIEWNNKLGLTALSDSDQIDVAAIVKAAFEKRDVDLVALAEKLKAAGLGGINAKLTGRNLYDEIMEKVKDLNSKVGDTNKSLEAANKELEKTKRELEEMTKKFKKMEKDTEASLEKIKKSREALANYKIGLKLKPIPTRPNEAAGITEDASLLNSLTNF